MTILQFSAPITGQAQTTSNTTSTLCSIDLSAPGYSEALNNCAVTMIGLVQGRSSGGDVAAAYILRNGKRISGTLATVASVALLSAGASGALLGDAALATALADLNVTGTTCRLQATGIAATTINFTGYLWIYVAT